ncbi:MAG: radical SAM family heme chaperone HemW [Bilifractor sp.]|jgi:oxygen-independent coproporphyrinogen-3 oxidase
MELYLHIPFCVRKCGYCDFLSFSAKEQTRGAYVDALIREIRRTGEAVETAPVTSVFVGGGTPTVLEPGQLERIFRALSGSFPIRPGAEISVEANPGTVDMEKLERLRSCGVNRLSIGCQAVDDRLLKQLGRIHDSAAFFSCFEMAREACFSNINVDLISAIPGQRPEDWRKTLRDIASLSPEHISAYSLILEEGTPFFEQRDSLDLPGEDEEREMYEETHEILERYGYRQYEISNYARPGFSCQHNIGYWTGVPYVGMGLGASSYLSETRFHNTGLMQEYLAFFGKDRAEGPDFLRWSIHRDLEVLSENDRRAEFVILGLRMTEGVRKSAFAEKFGTGIEDVFGEVIRRHVSDGLLAEEGDRIFLTRRGLSLANVVMRDFL